MNNTAKRFKRGPGRPPRDDLPLTLRGIPLRDALAAALETPATVDGLQPAPKRRKRKAKRKPR